ncbi:hypothetical protein [Vibrio anguillarum]|uniref:hypothetical protein n=4 Tax=Vibrio anguillarum TaxID=55601 RepID=UPI000BB46846|nr:hypothetical protein [Vibrio anguillarum]ATC60264.1 hypothetical protein CMV05_23020 [Vibrio anguillarum]MBF4249520.1 hypothetical protein [Vibrio anguillarum]MBF4340706.1 hypothetical protein [Vibrio anguillarum]
MRENRFKHITELLPAQECIAKSLATAPKELPVPAPQTLVEIILTSFGRKNREGTVEAVISYMCNGIPIGMFENKIKPALALHDENVRAYYQMILMSSGCFVDGKEINDLAIEVLVTLGMYRGSAVDTNRKILKMYFQEGLIQSRIAEAVNVERSNVNRTISKCEDLMGRIRLVIKCIHHQLCDVVPES